MNKKNSTIAPRNSKRRYQPPRLKIMGSMQTLTKGSNVTSEPDQIGRTKKNPGGPR